VSESIFFKIDSDTFWHCDAAAARGCELALMMQRLKSGD
jgi:hypothetical protein